MAMAACLALSAILGTAAHAAERLFSVVASSGNDRTIIQLGNPSSAAFAVGRVYDVQVPGGALASAQVVGEVASRPAGKDSLRGDITRAITSTRVLTLSGGAGSVEIHLANNTVTAMTLFDAHQKRVHVADIDGTGRGVLREADIDAYLCKDIPRAPSDAASTSAAKLAATPPLTEIRNLESKPGAAKVLYIDYWGGVITGTAWNVNYNGGAAINYTPFSTDADTANFSTNDQYLMYLGWMETAEDFAPFDINVTTRKSVYDATPVSQRSRIIGTTTDYFFPGAGGVAYLNVFGNGDYYGTGWAWNATAGSLGMTISHEAGHQFGLGHDGTASLGYYPGHGDWGPIMGAPFNKPYVQWSKGEYPGANNAENDLQIISTKVNAIADEAGGTKATAQALTLPVSGQLKLIAPAGLLEDVDVYSFTIPASTTVTASVTPWLGTEGENRGGNLGINSRLENSAGTVIASVTTTSSTPLSPATNKLNFSGTLAAGTYYLFVDAVTPNPNWSSGFGEYGHGGKYQVSVSAVPTGPGTAVPLTPTGTITQQTPNYVWQAGTGASWYLLEITGTAGAFNKWYGAATVNCPASTGNCNITPDFPLAAGAYSWRVQTYSDAGYGAWSASKTFNLQAGTAPPAAVPFSPVNGQTVTTTPGTTLTWDAASGATWYGIWVQDGTGAVIPTTWYTATSASCAARCSVTVGGTSPTVSNSPSANGPSGSGRAAPVPPGASASGNTLPDGAPLADGPGTWWVLTWNGGGFGPWSEAAYFNRSAGGALPRVSSPNAGAAISGASVNFSWTANSTTVSQYWIEAGSAKGGNNLFNQSMGTALSGAVTGLPANGSKVYVRFWWMSGGWQYADYVFTSN